MNLLTHARRTQPNIICTGPVAFCVKEVALELKHIAFKTVSPAAALETYFHRAPDPPHAQKPRAGALLSSDISQTFVLSRCQNMSVSVVRAVDCSFSTDLRWCTKVREPLCMPP